MVTKIVFASSKIKTKSGLSLQNVRLHFHMQLLQMSGGVIGQFLELDSFSSTLLRLFTQHAIWGWFGAYCDEGEPKHATMATRSARDLAINNRNRTLLS